MNYEMLAAIQWFHSEIPSLFAAVDRRTHVRRSRGRRHKNPPPPRRRRLVVVETNPPGGRPRVPSRLPRPPTGAPPMSATPPTSRFLLKKTSPGPAKTAVRSAARDGSAGVCEEGRGRQRVHQQIDRFQADVARAIGRRSGNFSEAAGEARAAGLSRCCRACRRRPRPRLGWRRHHPIRPNHRSPPSTSGPWNRCSCPKTCSPSPAPSRHPWTRLTWMRSANAAAPAAGARHRGVRRAKPAACGVRRKK